MKIGIFTDTFAPEVNGVAVSCKSLKETLESGGHEVVLFAPSKKTYYDEETHIYHLHGLFLKKLYGYRLVSPFRRKIYKFIRDLNLDLIHINTEYGVGLIGIYSSRKFNIPIVYTYHTNLEDYTYYITHGFMDKSAKKVLRKILKKYCEDVDEIIAPSEDTKLRLQKMNINKMINVVPTGFNFNRFSNGASNKEKCLEIKKNLQISDQNFILLCLGRIAKEKSFDIIIDNFRYFLNKTKKYDVKLLFVGDGPAIKKLKKQVEKYKLEKNVIFTGKVPISEVQYYYAISDIFLNASTTETQGLTYMEAMAAEKIVLCKRAKCLEDLVVDGVNAFYFEDEKDFTKKIVNIMSLSEKERKKITDNALASIDKYSSENFLKNIMRVYNRAIRDRF